MGELKELREQSESLVKRAKELGNKVYLTGRGAYGKAEANSEELLNKCVSAGSTAFGESAESKPKAVLAARGLLINTRSLLESAPEKRVELYEKFVSTGKQERGEKADATNEFLLAGVGAVATVRSEAQKLFDELVTAGEKNA